MVSTGRFSKRGNGSGSRVLAIALLLLAVPLTGCAGDAADEVSVPITAMEAYEKALPTADAWSQGAPLVTLSGFEGTENCPANAREGEGIPTHTDHQPGDGEAVQWVLIFADDALERTRTMRVTNDGATWIDDARATETRPTPLRANWTVDSTEALDAARESSNELLQATAATDACLFATLGHGQTGASWQIVARSPSSGQSATVFIDATTGEVFDPAERDEQAGIERFAGDLSEANETRRHRVNVTSPNATIALSLTHQNNGTRLTADLERGNGTLAPNATNREPGRYQARWTNLPEGAYDVRVGVEAWGNAEPIDYELAVRVTAS
jgi:hypothetical protein